ncbi:MAG: aldo/keto reductase [Gammaproteobacteria bacterium]|nr:aldo/keto reductase [Gammaproteobacteria bacterium]
MAQPQTNRRSFLEFLTMVGVGSQVLLQTRNVQAATAAAQESGDSEPWPGMTYRKLGRTGFRASRLVYGCGAALSRDPNDHLLNIAFEAGVNVYDVGYSGYYRNAERNLAGFAKAHADEIFLISKATVPVGADDEVDTETAQRAAKAWTKLLNQSLTELDTEHVDAYYQMAANNPDMVRAEEMNRAFEDAKAAGKVSYLGISTHENAQECLEAAIETGWYDLAMIAITPAGWYDWNKRQILEGSHDMTHLSPLLQRARDAGIGLVAMKTGRLLAGRRWGGGANGKVFDRFYDQSVLDQDLTDFQRSYAFVLAHGMDVVNADIQNYGILKENFIAAATADKVFASTA